MMGEREDDPIEPWELPGRRLRLPRELQMLFGCETQVVGVSARKLQLMNQEHSADRPYFDRMQEILEHYEYWGWSLKNPSAIELYVRIDGIWFTEVVFAPGDNSRICSIGTMHRIDRRKMHRRIVKYLNRRERG